MKKLYIGHSLNYATEEFKAEMKAFKQDLKKYFEILDFIGLGDHPAELVYKFDRGQVLKSDMFLAFADEVSTGLGIEIGIALENKKKLIIAHKKGLKISKMVLGIPKNQATFVEYEHLDEVEKVLQSV